MGDYLQWFAAGATIIGALVSIVRPDNTVCPVSLPANERALFCLVLGAVQACLHALSTGTSWVDAVGIALASCATAIAVHGDTLLDPKKGDGTMHE